MSAIDDRDGRSIRNGHSGRDGRKLKVAVLSLAHGHALGYLRLLQEHRDVEVVVTDPEAPAGQAGLEDGRGESAVSGFGARYVSTYEEALAWHPDAVVVCSENTRHRGLVEAAAAAGAHVLCEKPLATSDADAAAMVAAAKHAGVFLMVAYPVRFAPSFRALAARVQAGELGEVIAVSAANNGKIPIADRHWFVESELSGGGALVDHVVHCADLLDLLLGQPAATVHAVSNTILHADAGVETGGMVTVTYPGGVIATIDCSWSQPMNAPTWGGLSFEVIGTGGSVRINPFASHVGGYDQDGAAWLGFGTNLDALMMDAFLDGVRTGVAPEPSGDTGLRTVAVMTAAQESARSGRLVRLGGAAAVVGE